MSETQITQEKSWFGGSTWHGGAGLDAAALHKLPLPKLRELFQEHFGAPTASNNRNWIISKLSAPKGDKGAGRNETVRPRDSDALIWTQGKIGRSRHSHAAGSGAGSLIRRDSDATHTTSHGGGSLRVLVRANSIAEKRSQADSIGPAADPSSQGPRKRRTTHADDDAPIPLPAPPSAELPMGAKAPVARTTSQRGVRLLPSVTGAADPAPQPQSQAGQAQVQAPPCASKTQAQAQLQPPQIMSMSLPMQHQVQQVSLVPDLSSLMLSQAAAVASANQAMAMMGGGMGWAAQGGMVDPTVATMNPMLALQNSLTAQYMAASNLGHGVTLTPVNMDQISVNMNVNTMNNMNQVSHLGGPAFSGSFTMGMAPIGFPHSQAQAPQLPRMSSFTAGTANMMQPMQPTDPTLGLQNLSITAMMQHHAQNQAAQAQAQAAAQAQAQAQAMYMTPLMAMGPAGVGINTAANAGLMTGAAIGML